MTPADPICLVIYYEGYGDLVNTSTKQIGSRLEEVGNTHGRTTDNRLRAIVGEFLILKMLKPEPQPRSIFPIMELFGKITERMTGHPGTNT